MSTDLRTRALEALAELEARQVDDAYTEHEQLAAEACVAAASVLGLASEPGDWSPGAQLGVEARCLTSSDEHALLLAYRLVGLPGHSDRDGRLYVVEPGRGAVAGHRSCPARDVDPAPRARRSEPRRRDRGAVLMVAVVSVADGGLFAGWFALIVGWALWRGRRLHRGGPTAAARRNEPS